VSVRWYTHLIRQDVKALLSDGRPHASTEIWAIINGHGGGYQQFARTIQYLKDTGFYVAWVGGDRYQWLTDHDDTSHATQESLEARAIPELTRRVRAHRGELLRAVHHRNEDPTRYEDFIALAEGALSSVAVLAGRSPSRLISQTHLDPAIEAEILAEVP